jgi:hypothetical protein
VSGRVTVNGAALSAPEGEPVLALQRSDGDKSDISLDAAGAFRVVVVPGTYDLVYGGPSHDGAPVNVSTKVRRGVVIGDSAMRLDVDIPATNVSGSVTLNGETVTGASGDGGGGGYLFLADAEGAQAVLSTLADGSFSTLVIRGSYDLYYGSFEGSLGRAPNVPINRRAKLKEGIVVGEAPLALDWDVEAVRVAGTVVVNGAAIPDPKFGAGEVFLEGPDGDSGRLAFTSSESTDPNDLATGAYSALVIPVRYELYYRAYNGRGAVIPTNSRAHLGCFDVQR